PMRIREPPARNPILGERAPTRMTEAAGFDLLAQRRRGKGMHRAPCLRIDRPETFPPLVKANQQPLVRIFGLLKRPPALALARPGDVPGALAVAGLATDFDFGPGCGEAIARRIVILAHAGRVALGAHEIPVLVQLGPMQDVVVADLLIGIEVEPALAALVLWT